MASGRQRNNSIRGATEGRRAAASHGFTLIEITFAILILAGALVTLMGLQSASIQRSIRDRNKQHAMLIARQIFSAIETKLAGEEGYLEDGQKSGPPDKLINEILPNTSSPETMLDPENRFIANLNVSYWPIPKIDEHAVKRIYLTIAWSDDPTDSLSVVHFVPSGESSGQNQPGNPQ